MADADDPIRVGFLGAGFIARYHALQLQLSPEPNRVVAVADVDPGRAGAFCAELGGATVADVAEVVAASDVVFVCTWTGAHLDGVRAAVDGGRPVFCEKPLSVDLEGARRVAALVRRSGLPNSVGLVLRSSPALLALRELVGEPGSGPVMNVVFRDDQYLPVQGVYASTWRGDRELAGSGALLEHSIHDLDVLEWLLGGIVSVSAHQQNLHGLDGIEDSVSAVLRFASGATATLGSVWHDVLSRPSQRRIEVFCRDAVVTLSGDVFGPVRRQTTDGEEVHEGDALVDWLAERGVPLDSAETRFLSAVRRWRSGGDPGRVRPDVIDALRAHELVDAVYRSAASGGAAVQVAARHDG